jgi:hypothetical protein
MASYSYNGSSARLVPRDGRPFTPPSPPRRSFSPTQPLIASPARPSFQQQYDQRPMSPSTALLLPPVPSYQSHSGTEESSVRHLQRVFTRFSLFLPTSRNSGLFNVEQHSPFHTSDSSENNVSDKVITIYF